ncbi:MAG TPA: TolC family protein [Balneolales bacterium]|nr:TolC family protein [Balneolales bacterium]
MRWILASVMVCLIMMAGPDLRAQDTTQVHLQDLVNQLLENNPQLQSMRFDQQSAEAAIPAVGALPDPVLGLNLLNLPVNSFSMDQEPMTGKQITLMQHFPFPGKLDIKQDIARKEAVVREEKIHEMRNQLVNQLKTVYYELFYVDQALKTVRKSKVIIKQLISVAETKYSVGKGLQQDVLRAQLELSSLMDKEISLRQKRSSLAGKLNTLINEPPENPVGMISEPGVLPIEYSLYQLKEQADAHSPLLGAWQAVIDQSNRKVALAKKQIYPDFSVGLAYTQRDHLSNGGKGYDFVSAMFSISLPIYYKRKQNQQVQEMKLMRSSVEERYQNVRNTVYQNLQDTYTSLQKNQQLVDLYKNGVVPQAQQSFKSAMSAYQNDKVDFLSLLNSELALFNMQLTYYRALSDYNQNISDLEAVTGSTVQNQP